MSTVGPSEEHVVDARGLRCPLPVIRLAERAQELPSGTELTVLATDPAAQHDVPAWARLRGHTVIAAQTHEADGRPWWALTVRLGGRAPGSSAASRR
ncbi:sulfurtransferase TusA family protein [Isoptericola halotolerans]|uniref:sulfurtransferase TusA family protein n=1 Tax=Isoptericola halotolerans TaxID=300560 RepID=UPI000D082BDC|nr:MULTISPECIES: sulfurtransferase TusA family protein [Isoptericola]